MTDDQFAIRRWMSRYRQGYCDMEEALAAIRPIIETETREAMTAKMRTHVEHVEAAAIAQARPIIEAEALDRAAWEIPLNVGGTASVQAWLRGRASSVRRAVSAEPENPADVPWGRIAQDE